MEEKLVTLEEQMTSDRPRSWFSTITEETSNCRGHPTRAQTTLFQADSFDSRPPPLGTKEHPWSLAKLSVPTLPRVILGEPLPVAPLIWVLLLTFILWIKVNHVTPLHMQCCQRKQNWHRVVVRLNWQPKTRRGRKEYRSSQPTAVTGDNGADATGQVYTPLFWLMDCKMRLPQSMTRRLSAAYGIFRSFSDWEQELSGFFWPAPQRQFSSNINVLLNRLDPVVPF